MQKNQQDKIQQDKISIIVPVHNGQAYLTPCIESITAQPSPPLPELEIIIINDGSTDNTAAICHSLSEHHQNIQIITMEDLGVSCARNAGLSKATGNYITFIDADDRLLPGTLLYLWELSVRTDSDITGCGFTAWHNEADLPQNPTPPHPSPTEPKEDIDVPHHKELSYTGMHFIDQGILNGDTRCWGKLYRRQCITALTFQENLTIGEDMLFLLAATQQANKITTTDYKGYAYFQNPNGAMNRIFKESYMDQITCWQIATERIATLRPDLNYKAAGIILISIMLTVGKIAELPKHLRKQHQTKLTHCHHQLKQTLKTPGAYPSLNKSYRLKITIFKRFPQIYTKAYNLYHNLKHTKPNN